MNIFLNAVFGDGNARWQQKYSKGTVPVSFSSTNKSVIDFKAKILGAPSVKETPQNKKAYGTKNIFSCNKCIPFVEGSKLDLISLLDYEDLLLWILDDGSYHKKKGFLNLNSQGLTLPENLELAFHLWHCFGIESRVLPEKKKDGRLFFYQYIPGAQYDSIKPDLEEFMVKNNITGFEYKVGK